MIVYRVLVLLIISSAILLNSFFKKNYVKYLYCTFFCFLLCFVSAVRYDVGYDWASYHNAFVSYKSTSFTKLFSTSTEKGYVWLNKLLIDLGADYKLFFAFFAIILIVPLFILIIKYSDDVRISCGVLICMGVYYSSMCFFRQFSAAIIIIFAIQYIEKKQFMRFLICILFASLFHFSALFLLPFFFILRIKPNRILLLTNIALSILFYIFSQPILTFITSYVYKSYSSFVSRELAYGIPFIYFIFFSALFAGFYIFKDELIKRNSINKYLINMMMYACMFLLIGTKHAIVSRVALLFYIAPLLILVPNTLIIFYNKYLTVWWNRDTRMRAVAIISVVVILFSFIGFHEYLLNNNYNGVVPYKTYLNSEVYANE